MRLFLVPSVLYLLIVTFYMASAQDNLQAMVKADFETSFNERIQKAIDSKTVSGECTVASDKLSDDKCLSIGQEKAIKIAAFDAQPILPLDPGILDTTLSICNPRKGNCF